MSAATKIVIIVFCAALCGGGMILNSRQTPKDREPKSQIAPVINRQSQRGFWILV
jgi:hypothetical protein